MGVPKHVRVPADHLLADALHHVVNRERTFFAADLRMEHHLQKHIAQLFAHMCLVAFHRGIDKLARFFDQVRQQRMRVLLAIPGAAVLGAEALQDAHQIFKLVFHGEKDS